MSIDNRGKTPPLSSTKTDYPIIDVKALNNDSRIINFANCSKFVTKETYDNWFRNGHPLNNDILISTVGSIGELKIFFWKKGCIAQNVVALRPYDNPFYLYQYLKYIKNDLISYNIGSVQPSIKITHILKHPIYIPSKEKIGYFEKVSNKCSEIMFSNYLENNFLIMLIDTLLPKLMNGEIDVSNVNI